MSVNFGTLRRLNLRKIWAGETSSFTPWLADNIQYLGETLGMELELTRTEASVGDFTVDLLAEDLGTGHTVVIENQFERTDHDHLGKLITYAAGFGAGAVIWIAEEIRDEHRQALEWLNQHSDVETQFFGIVAEILQIDDSQPAYNFRLVVFPNEWQKSRQQSKDRKLTPRSEAYREFFQSLIDELREKHHFTNARIGQPQSWYEFASGFSGIRYAACFAQGARARTEVYIDVGDGDENKLLFDWLAEQKADIEEKCGVSLEWERLDDKRASRIAIYRPGSIEDGPATLKSIHSDMIDRLLLLKRVFGPLLKAYYEENRP